MTPPSEISTHLLEVHHVKRVPIVGDGRLVGIVSRADLLRCLATHKEDMGPAISQDDRAIGETLLATLDEEDIAPRHLLNVIVTSGVVHLWGIVENEEQRDAIRVAAENIGGMNDIRSHLRVVRAWIWGQ